MITIHQHFPPDPNSFTSALADIQRKFEAIMATQTSHLAALMAVRSALTEASSELVAKLQELTEAQANAGNTTPEIDAITEDLTRMSTALAAIVPNVPPPAPDEPTGDPVVETQG